MRGHLTRVSLFLYLVLSCADVRASPESADGQSNADPSLVDVGVLFPVSAGQHRRLLDLEALNVHMGLFDDASWKTAVSGFAFVGAPITRGVGAVSAVDLDCLMRRESWKWIATRVKASDPDLVRLAFRRGTEKGIPSVGSAGALTMTFQPFCSAQSTSLDAALHIELLGGSEQKVRSLLLCVDSVLGELVQGQAEAAAKHRSCASTSVSGEVHELGTAAEIAALLRQWRVGSGARADGFQIQAAAVRSSEGLPLLNDQHEVDPPMAHPLALRWGAETFQQRLFERLQSDGWIRSSRVSFVRAMVSPVGGLSWVFSKWNPRSGGLVENVVVDLGDSSGFGLARSSGLRLVSRLGKWDAEGVAQRSVRGDLLPLEREYYDRMGLLSVWDESPEHASRALSGLSQQTDPLSTGHMGMGCFDCHATQERESAAWQALEHRAPREFGYFFRAFGYIRGQPFVNRRALNEMEQDLSIFFGG